MELRNPIAADAPLRPVAGPGLGAHVLGVTLRLDSVNGLCSERGGVRAAGEAAGTAVRGSQLTAGALLSFVSGALAGAAELIDPARRQKSEGQVDTAESPEAKS